MGKRFSLITSTRDPRDPRLNWVRSQASSSVEVIVVNNPGRVGLGAAYNDGLAAATGLFCCFLHDDVEIRTEGWLDRLAEGVEVDGFDLVGVAGANALPRNGAWWNAGVEHVRGEVRHLAADGSLTTMNFGPPDDPLKNISPVVSLDGVLLFGWRERFVSRPFDVDLFDGFHFYDSDLCLRWLLWGGAKIAVVHGLEVVHWLGADLKGWEPYLNAFHYRHGGFLPLSLSNAETWRRNLAALRTVNPRVAELLTCSCRPGQILGFDERAEGEILARAATGDVVFEDAVAPEFEQNAANQLVLMAAGTGKLIHQLILKKDARLLVIEPEGHLACWLMNRFDWSNAIADGRLDWWIPILDQATFRELSRRETAIGLRLLHRRGKVAYLRTGSTDFHEDFFALPADLERVSAETTPQTGWMGNALRKPDDVLVLSPRCLIFNDLALCFQRLGLKTQRFDVPETPAEWTQQQRLSLIGLLRRETARHVICRNRVVYEAMPFVDWSELHATPVTSWWWDVPNAASMLDMTDAAATLPAYVFAKDLLSLTPEGSRWLPAAARLPFTEPPLDDCMGVPRDAIVTIVGQSRLGLLRENLNILLNGLHQFFGRWANKLGDDVNHATDVTGIYRLLERFHLEIAQKIASLRNASPPVAYYLGYLLEMCVTGFYRIAAVQSLEGFPLLVFGEDDWKQLLTSPDQHFRGALPPEHLLELYLRSTVNINISFMQVSSGVHPKVLDVAACGGEILTDHRPELSDLFPNEGIRPRSFGSLEELADKVSELLRHSDPDRRRARAEHVRKNHSLEQRARQFAVDWGLLDADAGKTSS